MSSVIGDSPFDPAPWRRGSATHAQPRVPRQLGLTKRRFIDLMRIGRTLCSR